MSGEQSSNDAERELDSFRRQWQEEVRRGKGRAKQFGTINSFHGAASEQASTATHSRKSVKSNPSSTGVPSIQQDDDLDGGAYHDLEFKDNAVRLGSGSDAYKQVTAPSEPVTALDHYERAVEREVAGSLGDSVSLYRRAFRVSICRITLSSLKIADVFQA